MDLVILLVLLALSAFFSGSETAYFSLRTSELARLSGREDRAGPKVVSLVRQAHNLLSAILIGNLLINTAVSVVATAACVRAFGERGLVVAVPLVTVALLVGGEITPKMLALRFHLQLALIAQRPLAGWLWFTRPVLRVIAAVTDRLVNGLPWERTGTRGLTTAELETACDLAVKDGTLSEIEGRFLARLLLLQHMEIHQIMTPRVEVVTLEVGWSREQVLSAARQAGYNRYPVITPDRPQPVGLFHLKDLLSQRDQDLPLGADLRPLLFVPESKDVAAMLAEMRSGQTHLAAVVDEHGDFTGIVTLADCLQALIGPVGDVSGGSGPDVFRIGDRTWIIGGRLDLREVWESCGVTLPTSRDYVTVAGYLMSRLGRIPLPGDRLTADIALWRVREMAGHKIVRVQLERLQDSDQEEQA